MKSSTESLPQRAKQPSVGGNMAVYSSETSAQLDMPPMWTPRSIRARGAGPFANGDIAETVGLDFIVKGRGAQLLCLWRLCGSVPASVGRPCGLPDAGKILVSAPLSWFL